MKLKRLIISILVVTLSIISVSPSAIASSIGGAGFGKSDTIEQGYYELADGFQPIALNDNGIIDIRGVANSDLSINIYLILPRSNEYVYTAYINDAERSVKVYWGNLNYFFNFYRIDLTGDNQLKKDDSLNIIIRKTSGSTEYIGTLFTSRDSNMFSFNSDEQDVTVYNPNNDYSIICASYWNDCKGYLAVSNGTRLYYVFEYDDMALVYLDSSYGYYWAFRNHLRVDGEDEPAPTVEPTVEPTNEPTIEPTIEPTCEPTLEPTFEPTLQPTDEPTEEPTPMPTIEPTEEPTLEPTSEPTIKPTDEPVTEPTIIPTSVPTEKPTIEPTTAPTIKPIDYYDAYVNTDGGMLNMRNTSSMAGKILARIPNGTKIKAEKTNAEWTRIKYNGTEGFVATRYITFNSSSKPTNIPVDPSTGKTAIVNTNSSRLNVRSYKSTNSSIMTTLEKGTTVEVIEVDGEWTLIHHNNIYGWVMSRYIKMK